MVLGVPLLDDLSDSKFLWACPHGNSKTCNSKRWKLPSQPCAESISTLNEWCQAMSTHLTLHWDFNFMDGSQLGRLGAVGPSELARAMDSSTNYKGQLNNLLHKLLRRPVVKGDVIYVLDSKRPFTASVWILAEALGGSEAGKFAGAACSGKKAAEQSAAARALEGLEELLNVRVAPVKAHRLPQLLSSNYKGQLVEQLQQLLGHTLMRGDVVFNTPTDSPPFVTSLEVNVMEEKKIVLSVACPNKKAAEQSAARAMVEQLQRDFSKELKTQNKSLMCGPMVPVFCCRVSVLLGDATICEAKSDALAFSSKQAAKESAAFLACDKLSTELEGSTGQIRLAEQIKHFCQELRPTSLALVESNIAIAQPHEVPRPVGLVI